MYIYIYTSHCTLALTAVYCTLYNIQVVNLPNASHDVWEISRSEIEAGDKLGQGNYGAVFKGWLTVAAMTPKIYAHKKEMDFEGKSHLDVAVKMLRCK